MMAEDRDRIPGQAGYPNQSKQQAVGSVGNTASIYKMNSNQGRHPPSTSGLYKHVHTCIPNIHVHMQY